MKLAVNLERSYPNSEEIQGDFQELQTLQNSEQLRKLSKQMTDTTSQRRFFSKVIDGNTWAFEVQAEVADIRETRTLSELDAAQKNSLAVLETHPREVETSFGGVKENLSWASKMKSKPPQMIVNQI